MSSSVLLFSSDIGWRKRHWGSEYVELWWISIFASRFIQMHLEDWTYSQEFSRNSLNVCDIRNSAFPYMGPAHFKKDRPKNGHLSRDDREVLQTELWDPVFEARTRKGSALMLWLHNHEDMKNLGVGWTRKMREIYIRHPSWQMRMTIESTAIIMRTVDVSGAQHTKTNTGITAKRTYWESLCLFFSNGSKKRKAAIRLVEIRGSANY